MGREVHDALNSCMLEYTVIIRRHDFEAVVPAWIENIRIFRTIFWVCFRTTVRRFWEALLAGHFTLHVACSGGVGHGCAFALNCWGRRREFSWNNS